MVVIASSLGLLIALALQPFAEGQCGADRWPVKIAVDQDAFRISSEVTDTSIAELVRIPIPEIRYPNSARIAPQELTRYRIRGRIRAKRMESDGDLHVILADEKTMETMIIEVPKDTCAQDSSFKAQFISARAVLQSLAVGSSVTVIGVGFFDFLHTATGQARNGFELHPVIAAFPETRSIR